MQGVAWDQAPWWDCGIAAVVLWIFGTADRYVGYWYWNWIFLSFSPILSFVSYNIGYYFHLSLSVIKKKVAEKR